MSTPNYQSTNNVNQFDSFYLSHSDSCYISCQSITESLKHSTKSVRQLAASETVIASHWETLISDPVKIIIIFSYDGQYHFHQWAHSVINIIGPSTGATFEVAVKSLILLDSQ